MPVFGLDSTLGGVPAAPTVTHGDSVAKAISKVAFSVWVMAIPPVYIIVFFCVGLPRAKKKGLLAGGFYWRVTFDTIFLT